jgi:hypothetical protein
MCDLVAIRPDRSGVTGIQVCGADFVSHLHKLLDGYEVPSGKHKGEQIPPNPYLKVWLQAGNPFFIWSWRPLKEGRETRAFYKLRQVEAILKDGQVQFHEIPDTSELKP